MSANKNTNGTGSDNSNRGGNDTDWDAFLAEHENDLGAVQDSRAAKKFEKKAEKEERQALLNAQNLKSRAFTAQARIQTEDAPRTYQTSWLDVDNTMDDGSPFVPPDPDISDVRKSSIVFGILLALGVIGIVVSVFLPNIIAFLAPVAGVLLIIGAAGLFSHLRGHTETKANPFDNGARV
jgi:preprotein translocase subunit SecF